MHQKHKDILQAHRTFLIKNIVWNESLAALLKQHHLLTESMVQDIQGAGPRADKIKALLDILPLRGNNSFEKFVDILQLTGHTFLADYLREEDAGSEVVDIKDMYRRVPVLMKSLKDADRRMLETYITEKIQAEQLKYVWKKEGKEKDKALDAQLRQIEQAYEFEEETKQKVDKISVLEQQVREAQDEALALKAQIRAMDASREELQQKHKEDLAVQIKYNTANQNALIRTDEKVKNTAEALRAIQERLQDMALYQEKDTEHDQMAKAKNEFAFMVEDMDRFVERYKDLIKMEQLYNDLVEERKWVLEHMGYPAEGDSPSLMRAYQEFALQNDEEMSAMRRELQQVSNMLEEQKSIANSEDRKVATGTQVWQNAIMRVMRKQLQDVKSELRKKETVVSVQEQDLAKLRERLKDLERQLAAAKAKHNVEGLGRERPIPVVQTESAAASYQPPMLNNQPHLNHQNLNVQAEEKRVSPESINGHISAPPDGVTKTPSPRGKVSHLPPLKYSTVRLSAEQAKPSQAQPRHKVPVPRGHEALAKPMLPESLITTSLKIDTRGKQMSSGLGDLKAIHNRGRNGITVERTGGDKTLAVKSGGRVK